MPEADYKVNTQGLITEMCEVGICDHFHYLLSPNSYFDIWYKQTCSGINQSRCLSGFSLLWFGSVILLWHMEYSQFETVSANSV